MFNLFKKKPKPALPPFETLAAYPEPQPPEPLHDKPIDMSRAKK